MTTTDTYTYRVMLLKHLEHDPELDSKLGQVEKSSNIILH